MIERALIVAGGSRADASSTLVDLARWARVDRDVTFTAVLLEGGPAATAWEAVAEVHVPPAAVAAAGRAGRLVGRSAVGRLARAGWLRRRFLECDDVDVVIAGSAEALLALDHLPRPTPPVVAHLPLLDETWARHDGPVDLSGRLAEVALTVVPAEPVAEWATRPLGEGGLGLPPGRVRHHPGPVPPPPRHPRPAADGSALVVGCGPLGWRAGADRFVALADSVGPEVGGRTVRWTWLGGPDLDGTGDDVEAEISVRGVAGWVRVVDEPGLRAQRVAAADLLVVTTREDPYPLAAVEAALAGTPVVGFRPGTALLAEAGHDELRVDRLDVDALARQVVGLLTDPDRGRLLAGDEARAAAGATTPLVADRLWGDIEDAVAGSRA